MTNNNSKRLKSEANSTPISKTNSKISDIVPPETTPVNEEDSEFIEVNTKLEQGYEKDDSLLKKENYSFDSNTSANLLAGDANSQDHGEFYNLSISLIIIIIIPYIIFVVFINDFRIVSYEIF